MAGDDLLKWVCDRCGSESDDEEAPCSCDGDYEDLIDEIRRLRNENSRLNKAGVTLRELIRKSLDTDDAVAALEARLELERLVAP